MNSPNGYSTSPHKPTRSRKVQNFGNEFILRLVFMHMLADRRLFPDVGTAGNETEKLEVVGEPGLDAEFHFKNRRNVIGPQDPDRKAFAGLLIGHVVNYLVTHEFEHIAQGHLDTTTIPETDLNDQTLELYCDQNAIWASVSSLILKVKDPVCVQHGGTFYKRPYRALWFWFFAICVYCRLWGDARLAGAGVDLRKGSHPPYRFRQLMIVRTIMGYLHLEKETIFGDKERVRELLSTSLRYAEHAFSLMSGQPISVQGLTDANDPSVREHEERLRENWRKVIRPILDHVKRAELPGG